MAGIGFVLRKLFKKNTLSSACSAYFHAMMATSGAWIFTVIGLGLLYLLTKDYSYYGYIDSFRAINLYNFCFSLVFTAPFTIIATRYLADGVYIRDLSSAMGMLFGNLCLALLVSTPCVFYFYFFYVDLSLNTRIMALIQFYLISSIWISSVFISTLKYYKGVSISFLIGMIIGVLAALQVASMHYETAGILFGFSLGLVVILSSILALVFNEYPKGFKDMFAFTV